MNELFFWIILKKKYEWCSHSRIELNSSFEIRLIAFNSEISSSEIIISFNSSLKLFKIIKSLSKLLIKLIEETSEWLITLKQEEKSEAWSENHSI